MAFEFEFLDWDSQFFNLRVGKLKCIQPTGDIQKELKDISEKNIDLLYLYTNEPLPRDFFSQYYDSVLVDTKIPIRRGVGFKTKNPKVSIYSENKPNKELKDLALVAGQYTRFKVDSRISEEKYKELFTLWIEKSVSGEMASAVLVYKENDKIVGFGTVLLQGDTAHVPLFAVNRSYEGKGISFAIMDGLESYVYDNGCKYAISSTQEVNKKALKVYERFGFKFGKCIYVYHLWHKEQKNG